MAKLEFRCVGVADEYDASTPAGEEMFGGHPSALDIV